MREIFRAGEPPKSLKFLYRCPLGAPVLRLLTCRFVSRLAGAYLDSRLSRGKIGRYVRKNGIDLSQYEKEDYRSFNEFFTRRIRPELRPFDRSPDAFVSPCDGKLSVYRATEGATFEIKGFRYTTQSLLRNRELAEKYEGGLCVVLRLTVTDYHRYFYLDDGTKGENVFLKGRFHTVQPVALEKRRVFSENCREYTVLHTERFGDVVQMEVGAMMVGRIVNNQGAGSFRRGEEKGRFEFGGSTIVLLVEKGRVELDEEFFENTARGDETVVKCGERIGTRVDS
ncbi:MAG: phosphatidylserine decarboxylase [Candidatus Gallimonas sp.]